MLFGGLATAVAQTRGCYLCGHSQVMIPQMIPKAWFPYNRPDRPSRLKKCSDDRDDHMETLPRRSQTTRAIQNLHDGPDHPDRTQFYPSDRGRLSRPGRLRSSG